MIDKTVCIVGSHKETRADAPFDDPDKTIWVLNEAPNGRVQDDKKIKELGLTSEQVGKLKLGKKIKHKNQTLELPDIAERWVRRWDAVFQIHKPAVFKNPLNFSDPFHWKWLQEDHGSRSIYMIDKVPEVPNSVKYPYDQIVEKYLSTIKLVKSDKEIQLEYFTSTFPYAIALALHLGFTTIEIYGVELSNGTEYEYQRSCFAFWLGIATGQGVEVKLNSAHTMFTHLIYGYEGDTVTLDKEYISKNLDDLNKKFKQLEREHIKIKDVLLLLIKDRQYKDAGEMIIQRQDHCIKQGQVAGQIGEIERYLRKYDEIQKASGEDATLARDEYELQAGRTAQKGEELSAEMWNASGKTEYVWHTWKLAEKDPGLQKRAGEQLRKLQHDQSDKAYKYGAHMGIYEFNTQCMMELDRRIKAAGGEKARRMLNGQ